MSESSHSKNFLEKQSFSELKELDISVSSFDRFIPRKSIIVDAIFGVGINRSLPREVECTLRSINQLSNPKVAIDVPTGINPSTGYIDTIAFRADLTISFFAGKQGTFTGGGRSHSGKVLIEKLSLAVQDELTKFHSSKLESLKNLSGFVTC